LKKLKSLNIALNPIDDIKKFTEIPLESFAIDAKQLDQIKSVAPEFIKSKRALPLKLSANLEIFVFGKLGLWGL